MRRLTGNLLLAATLLGAAGMATACSSGIGSSISSAIARRTASSPAVTSSSPSVPPVTVTTTVPPSSAAATPAQPSATATASPNGSGSVPVWLWIVIGLAVLAVIIGVIALISRSSRRRAAVAAGWRTKVVDVYAEGSALLDAMRMADARGLVARDATADAHWSDIQRRVDDLARALYALREEAPDDESRARVADVLNALQAARSAMDSARASGVASGPGEEIVRSRLAAFGASLSTLRSAYYPEV